MNKVKDAADIRGLKTASTKAKSKKHATFLKVLNSRHKHYCNWNIWICCQHFICSCFASMSGKQKLSSIIGWPDNCWYCFDRLKDISTPDFFTPSFNPGPFNPRLFNHDLSNPGLFNPRLFNHELFNTMVEKFIVEKSGVEKFMVENSGVERAGVEA